MRYSTFLLAAMAQACLCAPSSAESASSLQPRAADWTVDIYQDSGCSGASSSLSGTGTKDCTTGDILNGGGSGFILRYLSSRYTVYVYNSQDDCTGDPDNESPLDTLDSSTAVGSCFSEFEQISTYKVVKN